jgi:DNA-binding transcriptional ArsR family regulator
MIAAEKTPFTDKINLQDNALILKTLGHPVRLKIICMLEVQECKVKNIWECLGLEQCVVSQHLAVLKRAGIVDGKRRGAETHYSVINPFAKQIICALRQC